MEAQLEYSRLLHGSGHGIALRKAPHDINVGDLCYWTPEGKACRILNIFDHREVCYMLLPALSAGATSAILLKCVFAIC